MLASARILFLVPLFFVAVYIVQSLLPFKFLNFYHSSLLTFCRAKLAIEFCSQSFIISYSYSYILH